jgi:23S rRNA (adenine2503-C2)-methyltransferase
MKQDIRQTSVEQLSYFLVEKGEKPFRAKQVEDWIWNKSAQNFEQMSNLPQSLRQLLDQHFEFRNLSVHTEVKSDDQTIKLAFKLHDRSLIEGVLIPTASRMTACVSSQVGCALACKFCATGYLKRRRDLEPGEIYDQVVWLDQLAQQNFGQKLSNIVFMGMGEPLLNYNNVLKAIRLITSPQGLGMSSRRITLSTAGIAKGIKQLADDGTKFNLALSLHAASDEKRLQIMPINKSNSLNTLRDALKYYFSKTKLPVTYEYIIFKDFNDSLEDAKLLYRFTKHVPSKVNIIEYNPIIEADFVNTSRDRTQQFCDYLESQGVNVNIRRSRGKDVDAACGQLANKSQNNSNRYNPSEEL